MEQLHDLRVSRIKRLSSPRTLKEQLPVDDPVASTVSLGRREIENIMNGTDRRLLVIVGPCSIHNVDSALDYAKRLSVLRTALQQELCIMMRVYFEKPRTTVGWKGFINDPHLDDSYDIEHGLYYARKLLIDINKMGIPAATEFLDPITPQYVADVLSWAAIGARTIESQTHRQMASGLSMPVGFKNSTDGRLGVAVDAIRSAMHPHSFLGIDQDGFSSVITTKGNPCGHLVLRGGVTPNYDAKSIAEAEVLLEKAGLTQFLLVDCSHANSGKKHSQQLKVWENILSQKAAGNRSIAGVMIESNICSGNQPFPEDPEKLRYGVSITDECISWEETERMLRQGAEVMEKIISET
ncbi:MAG: 3-deoxy-7-phosphoheptulonate synthase [Chlorobium sp.]|uniref:3-deoxy-7-phosphoheptulonate synthase n=1 Tax=Chlorobium sp. TaxID=1095 RepID=UPI0025C265AB|nr:3-deoxy-7-phosphoheptulonate synthase [Chlorobium sp.]MCF8216048.1 3-deoxy-7-phosphoheptulonate synthase [Chlorobium sp.]MCF8270949.1 3-deoxy-7-phosphoheptulonate synthase [Chlorobium sp.]MCF8287323.1 3-deoxy-7-phosphoheptulonate synthase [Chlorobium sp.]MCF8291409.1 3-deoxy-7-phosphoheptulonate synthase [Chlorobium sp.]MCF8384957.1 3-deoxy-7-phosphoheptulonate synthase [Chlorobium sp.]